MSLLQPITIGFRICGFTRYSVFNTLKQCKYLVSQGSKLHRSSENRNLHIDTWPSLQVTRSFKIMECCGNSCGVDYSKEALKQRLTSQQYQVTQEKDTERAFTGKYCKHFEKGTYTCIVCNQDLFSSEAKYDSKCGWPAFFDVVDNKNVKFKDDLSHDMKRTEVSCSRCGAHLGHVFEDGPQPTGKRYCINSAALNFRKLEESTNANTNS